MINPLRRSCVVPVESPLPPAWLRVQPTKPDQPERVGLSLFRVGPNGTFHSTLVKAIDGAIDVVMLTSFLLSDEQLAAAMVRAAERGVRIYVLTASETRLAKVVREDDGFEARMVDEHKRLLNRLVDHVVLRSAEHFHAKLLVIDPATAPRGWVSTANFNKALKDSVELGVALSSEGARELAAWFSWMFWTEAERELVEKGRLAKVSPPPGEPPRPRPGAVVATGRGEASLREAVLDLLRSANRRLMVASYGLDADHDAVREIEERARAGVSVTVFTRPRAAVSDAIRRLSDAGAEVLAHDKLHAKAIVSDDRGLVMTANLQAYGLDSGFEVGTVLDKDGTEALAQTLVDWTRSFPWRFASGADRAESLGEICLAEAGLSAGRRTVLEEDRVEVGPVTAASALDLEAAPDPELPQPRDKGLFFQQIRFEWEVRPPRLPKNAKELLREVARSRPGRAGQDEKTRVKEPYDPPAYEHGGRKFVVLTDSSNIEDARQLATELEAQVVVP